MNPLGKTQTVQIRGGSGVAADQSGPWVGPRGEVGDREVSWGCGELGAVAGAPSTPGSAALGLVSSAGGAWSHIVHPVLPVLLCLMGSGQH